MSSTILYKFRSATTFEALPLPGSAARLFDVKKAIVKANKLDTGSMEFDLSVRNADTNEEYADESMLLPRGTRIIVQRLPSSKGMGFLARMARNEYAGAGGGAMGGNASHQQQHSSNFYTIDSRTRENEEEEFVQSSAESELAALQAVTNMQTEGPTMTGGAMGGGHRGGRGGPPAGMGGPPSKPNFHHNKGGANYRPNADPELREQEKKLLPKKRATGIPRTFLNLSAPPPTDGNKEGGESEQTPTLQPNRLGFAELVNRGGGQSENTTGTRRDLDYALKITSTTVPEHLQCAICHSVVKNAMLLPWDTEGRTVCETCIRDALAQNGFRCPLTGMEGVSPDDLIPNVGLRKAAELFIKGVMEKVDEIEQQQVEESTSNTDNANAQSSESNILDGEGVEKGVIVSKRTSLSSRKKSGDADPFGGGEDDFGGDVFAVEVKKDKSSEPEEGNALLLSTDETEEATVTVGTENIDNEAKADNSEPEPEAKSSPSKDGDHPPKKEDLSKESSNKSNDSEMAMPSSSSTPRNDNNKAPYGNGKHQEAQFPPPPPPPPPPPRRQQRRRGPPVGYAMGPAGGAVGSARANQQHNLHPQGGAKGLPGSMNDNHDDGFSEGGGRGRGGYSPRGGGGRSNNLYQDRGGGPYGRGGGRGRERFGGPRQEIAEDNRGTKRSWDDQKHDSEGGSGGSQRWEQSQLQHFDDHGGRGGYGSRNPNGRGVSRGSRDGGGRGDDGGGGRGGGGGGRSWGGPRGNFRGRGRGRF